MSGTGQVLLHLLNDLRQGRVFKNLSYPVRVIPLTQMMHPGLVIHARRELTKPGQILSTEIQVPVGAAKIKASLGGQLSLRILALVASSFSLARLDEKPGRPIEVSHHHRGRETRLGIHARRTH